MTATEADDSGVYDMTVAATRKAAAAALRVAADTVQVTADVGRIRHWNPATEMIGRGSAIQQSSGRRASQSYIQTEISFSRGILKGMLK